MDEITEYEIVDWSYVKSKPLKMADESMEEARSALARPEPQGPTAVEIRNMWLFCNNPGVFARALLARWGRSTPKPISASERLPEPLAREVES
jgi:hypothetical protein